MKKENNLEKKSQGVPNSVFQILGLISAFLALYGLGTLHAGGEPNPFKWKEAQEKIYLIQQQSSYRKQFHKLDKNNDFLIDSTEFIYRK